MKRTTWYLIAPGLILLAGLTFLMNTISEGRVLRGENDFVQLYIAAKLAGTPRLYDKPANLEVSIASIGETIEHTIYTRPPFYAVFLKPLALLPYHAAYILFSLLTLASVLWYAVRLGTAEVLFITSQFVPVILAIGYGQDTPFLLVFLGASLMLEKSGRHFLSGLVLSLCAIKFHLFLFVPIALILTRRWRVFAGGTCGVAALFALGVLVNGWGSTAAYVRVLRDPFINPTPATISNIHGLVATLHGGIPMESAFAGLALLLFSWTAWKSGSYPLTVASGLLFGLLVSYHSSFGDEILLLPVFALMSTACVQKLPGSRPRFWRRRSLI